MRSLPHYCLLVASNVYPPARVTRDFLKSIRAVSVTHITNRVIKTVGLEPNGTILSFRNITMKKQIQNGTNFIPATPELRALNITATFFKRSLWQSLQITEALKKTFRVGGSYSFIIKNVLCESTCWPHRHFGDAGCWQEIFFQRNFVSLLIPCLKFLQRWTCRIRTWKFIFLMSESSNAYLVKI